MLKVIQRRLFSNPCWFGALPCLHGLWQQTPVMGLPPFFTVMGCVKQVYLGTPGATGL